VSESYDLVVVGAGIVGLASTLALLEQEPGLRIAIVERHDRVAAGQSGHNSGVLHAGVYYKPGSYKARLCRAGRLRMIDYCERMGVAHRLCGKLVVATTEPEVERLVALETRARENGLEGLEMLAPDQFAAVEPHARGLAALRVPESGVVDFGEVCAAMAQDLVDRGVTFRMRSTLLTATEREGRLQLALRNGSLRAKGLLNCAGLWSDEVARACGVRFGARVVPFRGEYWKLREDRRDLVRALIYPVPDPALPFLGVHLTRDVHGVVDAGPNAVFAFAREGYTRGDIDLAHLVKTLTHPGFLPMARQHWRHGLSEMRRSLSPRRLLADLQRLVPELRLEDLEPAPAGVRAQVVGADGALVDDFLFASGPRSVHVLNAPSPAATASLAIGDEVARRVLEELF
jgi:L-2-hydroxyglutarate oxidase